MLPTARLTKRQKKGIAFRERKHNKGKDEAPGITGNLESEIDVPSLEDQVLVVDTQGEQGRQISAEALVGKREAGTKAEEAEPRVVVAGRKRKGKASEEAKGVLESGQPTPKRRKRSDGSHLDDMQQSVEDHASIEAKETGRDSEKTKQRYILFLGTV